MYTLLLLAEVQLNFDYSAYITTCLIKPNVFYLSRVSNPPKTSFNCEFSLSFLYIAKAIEEFVRIIFLFITYIMVESVLFSIGYSLFKWWEPLEVTSFSPLVGRSISEGWLFNFWGLVVQFRGVGRSIPGGWLLFLCKDLWYKRVVKEKQIND